MIFLQGALCHPYMALQQHDLLQDVSVRCFVVGASNVLFKHKRQILDVIVEVGLFDCSRNKLEERFSPLVIGTDLKGILHLANRKFDTFGTMV